MPAARALPWLLVGVVLAGCARTGPGLPVAPAPAPDVLVDLLSARPDQERRAIALAERYLVSEVPEVELRLAAAN